MKKVSYFVSLMLIIAGLELIMTDGEFGAGVLAIICAGGLLCVPKEKFEKWEEKRRENKQYKKESRLHQTTPEPKRPVSFKKIATCPNCGSTNINFLGNNRKGFSVGKSVGGAMLTGGIGTLAGFAGKKGRKDNWHCGDCGTLFKLKKI